MIHFCQVKVIDDSLESLNILTEETSELGIVLDSVCGFYKTDDENFPTIVLFGGIIYMIDTPYEVFKMTMEDHYKE